MAQLSFLDAAINGQGGVTGMQRALDVCVSPDGLHVYAPGRLDDGIAIFDRLVDGTLDFVGNSEAVAELERPLTLTMADDAFLYVGSDAAGCDNCGGVVVFERDSGDGSLTFAGAAINGGGTPTVTNLVKPVSVVASRDGLNLYAVSLEGLSVVVFSRNPTTGLLTQIDVEVDDGGPGDEGILNLEGPQALAESPDGDFVYVVSQSRPTVTFGVGGIAVFSRDAEGRLAFIEGYRAGDPGIEGLWGPRDVVVSPDGAYLYVANGGRANDQPPQPASLSVYRRLVDGTLEFVEDYDASLLGETQFNAIKTTADGSLVLVVAQGPAPASGTGTLMVFERDATTGLLTLVQEFANGSPTGTFGLAGAFDLALSDDGENAYVASEQEPVADPLRGAVAVFAVPEADALASGLAVIATLVAQSQSRARRNSSPRRASGEPGSGRQS
jgi:6-phosphogluconolactonase (cycloisomerase 2 family)